MLQVASKSLRLARIQDKRSENPPLDGRSVIQFADIHSNRFDSSRTYQWTPYMALNPREPSITCFCLAGWLHWNISIHCGRSGTLLSLEYMFTLSVNLPSFPIALLPKPPSVELQSLIHVKVFPQHSSWPRNSFTSNWSAAVDSC